MEHDTQRTESLPKNPGQALTGLRDNHNDYMKCLSESHQLVHPESRHQERNPFIRFKDFVDAHLGLVIGGFHTLSETIEEMSTVSRRDSARTQSSLDSFDQVGKRSARQNFEQTFPQRIEQETCAKSPASLSSAMSAPHKSHGQKAASDSSCGHFLHKLDAPDWNMLWRSSEHFPTAKTSSPDGNFSQENSTARSMVEHTNSPPVAAPQSDSQVIDRFALSKPCVLDHPIQVEVLSSITTTHVTQPFDEMIKIRVALKQRFADGREEFQALDRAYVYPRYRCAEVIDMVQDITNPDKRVSSWFWR